MHEAIQTAMPLAGEPLALGMERITIESGPDERGRYHYVLEWVADYHPGHPEGEYGLRWRGQHFFGEIPERFRGGEAGKP
jgi:hypothetical protein